ncbi:MAG TPA: SDR family NAD(P)-dependent oxidoreductase [Solirubrobacterales bacterium]|nr:SDR family NAD(P)-dependent oxidoreductase [Solirubrobacterales bacterium]
MRSALVTGSSTGIGRATALRLDRAGWRVFAGVRRETDAASLRAQASERLTPVMLEITEPAAIGAAAELLAVELEGRGLDGLVNNAGIAVLGPLETIPIDDLRNQLEVNLVSQVSVTQALLPLIRRAQGRIVFVSSIGGRMALPFGGPYHASKYGVEAVADCFRQELRPWRIEVAVIEPGSIDTPIWERGERLADEVSERAPDTQEQLYGETIERFRVAAKRTAERGVAPEKVARAIAAALVSDRPRTRYLVGADARGQALLRSLLPDRLMDRAVARVMRI